VHRPVHPRRAAASLAAALGCAVLAAGCGSAPRPRPDIVFVSTRGGDYAVYGMNADGSRTQRLSRGEKGDASSPQKLFFQDQPAWSDDGRLIAFTSKREGTIHVFVMQADGSGTRRVTDAKQDDSHPTWSPDGRWIAFARGQAGDLWRIHPNGSGLYHIDSDPADESDPAWSPVGGWIAYSRRTPGSEVEEIWLMRPDGTHRHELTHLGAASKSPAWSPDGRRIAFSSNARGGGYAIYTIGLGGGRVAVRTNGPEDFEPTWAPDGQTIGFSRSGTIDAVEAKGAVRELSKGENDIVPAWRPKGSSP
jgi:Tol biopolymer transport system component